MTALSPEELSTEGLAEIMAAGGRPADSERKINIIDTTLRDAHQSIWATRMTTSHILSLLDDITNAGFEHVDLVAPIQFDVSVRYLKEDPWERVRLVHENAAPGTKFRALIRSKNLASFDFLPDDAILNWTERGVLVHEADQEADGKDAEGGKQRGGGIALVEHRCGDEWGEDRVGAPLVPFKDLAGQAGCEGFAVRFGRAR